jgi:hypothetical protein
MDRENQPYSDIEELGAEPVPGSGFENEEPDSDDGIEEDE